MPQRPRIAIPIPTSTDVAYNRVCWREYSTAVDLAGGEAVEVPLDVPAPELIQLGRSCIGVLLPGSPADVDPRRYAQTAVAACAQPDPARETVDLLLLEEAGLRGMPVLAICFGAQILNVSRGGSLLQDLTVMPVNHAAGRSVAVAHTVSIRAGSLLGAWASRGAGSDSSLANGELVVAGVNSSHHQAVGIPGGGLRVVARCPQDGVIEALEGDEEGFLVAVQWHPERDYATNAVSRALFGAFLAATQRSS